MLYMLYMCLHMLHIKIYICTYTQINTLCIIKINSRKKKAGTKEQNINRYNVCGWNYITILEKGISESKDKCINLYWTSYDQKTEYISISSNV